MRLIDADKLEAKHFVQRTEKIIGYDGTQPRYELKDVLAYAIDDAPTVNAIPWQALVELMRHQPHDIGKSQYTGLVKKWLMENDEDFRKYMEEQEYREKQSSRFD